MLPPKGDRRRPLAVAVLFTRLLGGACVAAVMLVLFLIASTSPVVEFFTWWTIVVVLTLVLLLPAGLYVGFSFPLERKRKWAAISILAIAGVQTLVMAFDAIRVIEGLWGEWGELAIAAPTPVVIGGLGVATIVTVAIALSSFKRKRAVGFEPILQGPTKRES